MPISLVCRISDFFLHLFIISLHKQTITHTHTHTPTPVGLCAQAWNMKIEPLGAPCSSYCVCVCVCAQVSERAREREREKLS